MLYYQKLYQNVHSQDSVSVKMLPETGNQHRRQA
jgi:hypothetical protein